ncbi:glycine oxidase ThiO [Corynebacterium haemomassiliense]|uniref:glycine oxidase ThiO n=1 Tax=Corynebacterium haemomassiliense TaxID=2754726 RepID=UPI0028896A74|nr:glycine oxidase ThiO [Corynebacterium haemomassiliense]
MIISVVGAGIIGLTTALTLADRGHTVTIHDPEPASGATHHAGGMLAPTAEVVYKQDPLFPLMRASAEWYPELIELTAKYTGLPAGYRTDGTLVVARDTADKTHLNELREYQSRHGMSVDKLTTRQARRLEPALSPAINGAVRIDGDHQVQPRLFTRALLDACRSAHVTFTTDRIDSLDQLGNADQVVVANGLGASQLVEGLDLRPVYGDVLHVRVPKHQYPLLTRVVRGFVEDRPVYLIPREDGTLTIGATTREDGRGNPQVQGIHQLLRDAIELVPALEECDFVEATAGARPGTPDDLPYLGRIDERTVVSPGVVRPGGLLAGGGARGGAGLGGRQGPSIDLTACDPRRHS